MAAIGWTEGYSVGFPEIDSEHKILIEQINLLIDAIHQRRTDESLYAILEELTRYTRTHFHQEEELFARHGYPEAATHSREHRYFVEELVKLRENLDGGNRVVAVEMMTFLSQWFVRHINGKDKKYAGYFADRGVRTVTV